ncbi:MAG: polysaccharide biosynthesis protein [Rhodobacterales bacterium]|nr:polysaccharide biosynthesis protein [Rhodobacterales bacterium]
MTLFKPIPPRGFVAFGHDIVMAGLSFWLSIQLRLGGPLSGWRMTTDWPVAEQVQAGVLFVAIAALTFWMMGLYRGVWRYASMNDLMAITKAVTAVVLVFLLAMFLWTRLDGVPRSLFVINWFVLMALLGGPRFLYRSYKDKRVTLTFDDPQASRRVPVLLVGAGDGAELFIRSMARDPGAAYRVVGILSETKGRVGRDIHGVQVLGTVEDMPAVVARFHGLVDQPEKLIVTKDDMDGARVRRLLDRAEDLGLTLARMPRLTDLRAGLADRLEVRPVALEDLLGRPQTALDPSGPRTLIKGRRVLVTGAGGSIGSELVRQIAGFGPSELVLVEQSEFALYTIDREMAETRPDLPRAAVLADVRDGARVDAVFAHHRPHLVFHAAALKHVPMVEANPFEGVLTNVAGTRVVADACRAHGVETMVLISTDKAVNPTSVMGATKRVAERYCQALDLLRRAGGGGAGTCFVTVRFGNVLGSTGSVVPLFQRQLAAGGPLTVTHADMKRYFMTVREAVELVLQASALGSTRSDGAGTIFVLDMGEPVKIIDLARQVIRLAGLKPDVDVAIEITGLRPGEKLFEEIFHGGEPLVATGSPGLLLAAPRTGDAEALARALDDLAAVARAEDRTRLMVAIQDLVPEYTPDTGQGGA